MNKHVLNAKGLLCPEPVMMLHQWIHKLTVGEQLTVFATDPSTERDIPKFCHYLGHKLISHTKDNEVYQYVIKKQ